MWVVTSLLFDWTILAWWPKKETDRNHLFIIAFGNNIFALSIFLPTSPLLVLAVTLTLSLFLCLSVFVSSQLSIYFSLSFPSFFFSHSPSPSFPVTRFLHIFLSHLFLLSVMVFASLNLSLKKTFVIWPILPTESVSGMTFQQCGKKKTRNKNYEPIHNLIHFVYLWTQKLTY